jgi:hypothetical protein
MPSQSLLQWKGERVSALDELEAAHRSVGGTGPGRRYATQQINQAYTVLLSSQFQGYCRDLHFESADYLVQAIASPLLRSACQKAMILNRKLNQGNPNPGNLGSDFNRFGLVFWGEVRNLGSRNQARQDRLEELSRWRNAIAHQDFDPAVLGSTTLRLRAVRAWRNACERLATSFDEVMRRHLHVVTGISPW